MEDVEYFIFQKIGELLNFSGICQLQREVIFFFKLEKNYIWLKWFFGWGNLQFVEMEFVEKYFRVLDDKYG